MRYSIISTGNCQSQWISKRSVIVVAVVFLKSELSMAFAVGLHLFNQPRAPFALFYMIDPAIRLQLNLKNHCIGDYQIRDFFLLQLQQVSQDNPVHTLVSNNKGCFPFFNQSVEKGFYPL